ncbi:MAG: hypothetical protein KGR26_06810, partial [Cyanobacteria bacterium REEB65]|nr:hypothetical protein [Cyanobacteria bacterium REEB65]
MDMSFLNNPVGGDLWAATEGEGDATLNDLLALYQSANDEVPPFAPLVDPAIMAGSAPGEGSPVVDAEIDELIRSFQDAPSPLPAPPAPPVTPPPAPVQEAPAPAPVAPAAPPPPPPPPPAAAPASFMRSFEIPAPPPPPVLPDLPALAPRQVAPVAEPSRPAPVAPAVLVTATPTTEVALSR